MPQNRKVIDNLISEYPLVGRLESATCGAQSPNPHTVVPLDRNGLRADHPILAGGRRRTRLRVRVPNRDDSPGDIQDKGCGR